MHAEPPADRALLERTAAAIQARRQVLAEQVVVEMYRNPFWQARYGDRGKIRALEDAGLNFDNLAAVLRLGIVAELGYHYRWLRGVLVVRGMCSRHVQETMEAMRRALTTTLPAGEADAGCAWLRVAEGALIYDHPFAQALAPVEDAVIAGALARLAARPGAVPSAPALTADSREGRDLRYHLSYLTDALALDRPDLFVSYAAWVAGFLPTVGATVAGLRAGLQALGDALTAELPAAAAPARDLLGEGLRAVDRAAPADSQAR
jgi:hypothetical protein